MYPNPNFLIDEIARVVVRLPADAIWYGVETFVPIVVDSIQPQHKLLLDCSRGMEYLPSYRLFERLCKDRVRRAAMGHLRIHGLVVQPERYPGAVARGNRRGGHSPRVGCRIRPSPGRARPWQHLRPRWPHDLLEQRIVRDIGSFCRKYQDQLTLTVYDRGDFSLDLDLRDEDAARDAFGISCLLPLSESGYVAPPNRIFVDLEHLGPPLRRLLQARVPGERLQRV